MATKYPPECPECGTQMALFQSRYISGGRNLRQYVCPACLQPMRILFRREGDAPAVEIGRSTEPIDMSQMHRKSRAVAAPREQQLCWRCRHAAGPTMCRWALDGEVIPGWDAEQQDITCGDGRIIDTYYIKACPEFEPDPPRREVIS